MADSSNTSPCKVSYNGAMRRFLLTRPASWTEFEYKIRSCYALSPELELSIQYKDDEGDIITLSTETELQDVLAMHAIFHQSAPVKFEISVFDPQHPDRATADPTQLSISSSVGQSLAASIAGSSIASPAQQPLQPPLTAWGLAQLNQEHDRESLPSSSAQTSLNYGQDTPLAQFYRQSYHRRYGSEQSDDVSLIELEDGIEPPLRTEDDIASTTVTSPRTELEQQSGSIQISQIHLLGEDQSLIYPTNVIGTEMAEINQAENQLEHDHDHVYEHVHEHEQECEHTHEQEVVQDLLSESAVPIVVEPFSRESSSSAMSQHTALEQHEDSLSDATVDKTPVPEFEALHLDTSADEVTTESSKDAKGKGRAVDADETSMETSSNLDADPSEPLLPSTSTASTSTSERDYGDEDRALFEQFQLLVREFQHVIQNNPQLVALAGTILDKIVNQVKVNVESFATYLQHQAQDAAQAAQQAAAEAARGAQEAARGAQEAAREAQETARESIREGARNHPFFGRPAGCPFSDNQDFPFFPHHRFMGHRGDRLASHTPPPPPPPPAPAPAAVPVSPTPPTPPVPPMPPMPPMPSFFGSCSSTTRATSSPHPSKPSPFVSGFPFITPSPKSGKPPKWRGRPKAQDTEANNGEGSSSPSSGMPGSFPSSPAMVELHHGAGWTWMRLPEDDLKDQHLPPSTRAKYGWVWRDASDKSTKAELKETEATATATATATEQGGEDPSPLYTPLASNDPPATFPFGGGRGGHGDRGQWTGLFRGRGGMHHATSGPRGHHHHHHHHGRRHSGAHSDEESETTVRASTADDVRDASLRRRQTMIETRQAAVRARHEAEEERKRHHQARVEQLVKKSRPHSHIGSFLFGGSTSTSPFKTDDSSNGNSSAPDTHAPVVMGGGSLANIWPSAASAPTTPEAADASAATRTPGEFPQARVYTPVPTTPARPAAPTAVVPPTPSRASTPASTPVERTVVTTNPFQDPYEFEHELQTLLSMGFPDSEDLRTALRDFGGEIEAVIDYLFGRM
ncbi:hypothetical protein DFQ26_005398 [Actinomortierella ambigua]|nr:hypothetical protein DFQ26_005398 [Actinomortierella ambigua]